MISKTISLLLVLVLTLTFVTSERENIDGISRENSPTFKALFRNETNNNAKPHYEGGITGGTQENDSESGVGISIGIVVG
eukprot:GAHX01000360.1.p1 GENE.GAHX01000360.1~~GAHX01000360.1.p1  ORF type:complete len:80 (+),score=12.40 GAHX01000360.1:23-262(+)